MSASSDADVEATTLSEAESPAKVPESTPTTEEEAPRQRSSLKQRASGLLLLLLGSLPAFTLMGTNDHWRASVPVGLLSCLLAARGAMQMIGSFGDTEGPVARRGTLGELAPRLLEATLSGSALLAVLYAAVQGVLPKQMWLCAVLVPATFLWLVTAIYRTGRTFGAWREDEGGRDRRLHERHGFWLIAITTLIYLPLLGSYSLSDPWETHYGEVAREMLSRDDWISLWWAQDGWFWSKPILNFWMQGLSFSLLGVQFEPGQMLAAVNQGLDPHPEWAARTPLFILTLLGAYSLYSGVAQAYGRRPAFFGVLILLSTPYWYFVAHQTMADMPYVAPLCAAMGLLLLALNTDADKIAPSFELHLGARRLRISAFHLVVGVILLTIIPQVLYLYSRNVAFHLGEGEFSFSRIREWLGAFGYQFHADVFWSGSGGGNCGLPGNRACVRSEPVNRQLQPWILASLWTALTAALLISNRRERRLKRIAYLAAWYFVALAAMGKGAPGFILPVFAFGAFIVATRRFDELGHAELPACLALLLCVALPWYVQMFMRHGSPFTDRLIFHDMFKRAFVHVHDTNKGSDVSFRYYLWQLGYGLFPWSGMAVGGLFWWMRRGEHTSDRSGNGSSFLFVWLIACFGMFTITLTKFHHYILPLVPPACMLTGALLDRLFGDGSPAKPGKLPHYLTLIGSGSVLMLYGTFRNFPGTLSGDAPGDQAPLWWVAAVGIGLGVVLLTLGAIAFGRQRIKAGPDEARTRELDSEHSVIAALGVMAALTLLAVTRDLTKNDIKPAGNSRLMQLFTYNYSRHWPEHLDFQGILLAFGLVSAVLCLLLVVRPIRHHVATALCASALVGAVWGVNVYLVRCSPHWGQRETMQAYYEHRSTPKEPLVAYQMNWKGENFYLGNKMPAFVSSGKKFKQWMKKQKKLGVKVFFFTTEHSRISSLKRELDNPKKFDVLTTKKLNNKFLLARYRVD